MGNSAEPGILEAPRPELPDLIRRAPARPTRQGPQGRRLSCFPSHCRASRETFAADRGSSGWNSVSAAPAAKPSAWIASMSNGTWRATRTWPCRRSERSISVGAGALRPLRVLRRPRHVSTRPPRLQPGQRCRLKPDLPGSSGPLSVCGTTRTPRWRALGAVSVPAFDGFAHPRLNPIPTPRGSRPAWSSP